MRYIKKYEDNAQFTFVKKGSDNDYTFTAAEPYDFLVYKDGELTVVKNDKSEVVFIGETSAAFDYIKTHAPSRPYNVFLQGDFSNDTISIPTNMILNSLQAKITTANINLNGGYLIAFDSGIATATGSDITFDNAAKFLVSDSITLPGNLMPHDTASLDIGSSTLQWNNLYLAAGLYSNTVSTGTVSAAEVKIDGILTHKNALLNNSVSVAVGTGGAYGTASTVLQPDINHVGVIPITGSVAVGGTVASGETITVEIIATYSDATTASITKSFSAVATDYLTAADLLSLIKDGVYIKSISAQAESSATSTAATVTVTMAGMQQ